MNLGTDPEFFIYDPAEGRVVPAHLLFPLKKDAQPIKRANGTVLPATAYRDGYVVEINLTMAPTCREGLAHTMSEAIYWLNEMLKPKYQLQSWAAAYVNPYSLKEAPADVAEFGCSPSLNAYTGEENRVEIDGWTHDYRYAGGHLHLSIGQYDTSISSRIFKDKGMAQRLVKFWDLFVGVPLTYLTWTDMTYRRRMYYGKAGEFRMQNYRDGYYGIEYRTPDPSVWNNTPLASFATGMMREVVNQYNFIDSMWNPGIEKAVQDAINLGQNLPKMIQKVGQWYSPAVLDLAKRILNPHVFITQPDLRYGQNGWHTFLRSWTDQKCVKDVYSTSSSGYTTAVIKSIEVAG